MRYYRKKRIREKFQILEETHRYIRVQMCENREIVPILADCQTLAIEIGEEIEECQGSGSNTVALLEAYCEALYHIAQRKYPGLPEKMAKGTERELEKALSPARKSFEEDIQEERLVVFFPYKASMWDSMESIWKRLKEEENTECMVVPLPFYVKNGKEKAEFCYEGAEFPEDAEIVSYKTVLQTNFYADIAIYHNPYDDVNKLTQVDERFFSSQLHTYADTLVYIPYYVLAKEPEVSFILLPGVKNADYVALQDEKTAEAFRYWYPGEPKKFLVTESPKITKVKEMAGLDRETLNIPEAWKAKIRGKKVLFYNTHLANLMKKDLDYIGRLRSVFDTMRTQENVVLWWRPHPLTEAVRFQIGEEKYREYEALIDWYKKADFGIYDDTPNLHEAIAASDGYYGDTSSVTKLFQAAGKPVMIQRKHESGCPRLTEDACIAKGKLWYVSILYNGLFSIDLKSGETEFAGEIPDETGETELYKKMLVCGDKLVLVPFNASAIAIYDLKKKTFSKCGLETGKKEKFYSAQIYDGRVYMLPECTEGMYIYSIEKNCIEHKELFHDFFKEKAPERWICVASAIKNEKLYFILYNTNILCSYDFRENTLEYVELPFGDCTFFDFVFVKEGIFAVANNEPRAFYWNSGSKEKREFVLDSTYNFGNIEAFGDKVIYKPLYEMKIMEFDLNRGTTITTDMGDVVSDTCATALVIGKKLMNKICFLPVYPDKCFYFSDGKSIRIKDERAEELAFIRAMKAGLQFETEVFTLERYIHYLKR